MGTAVLRTDKEQRMTVPAGVGEVERSESGVSFLHREALAPGSRGPRGSNCVKVKRDRIALRLG